MKLSRHRTRLLVAALAFFVAFWGTYGVESQIVINEVIAENSDTPPEDIGGGSPDMIELYNLSDEAVQLGAATAAASYHLSDGCSDGSDPFDADDCPFPGAGSELDGAWRFPEGTVIEPNGFLVVFCDGDDETQGLCELHASFEIASNGDESIVLWSPEDAGGDREVADRVWLPPLPNDVSFARRTDGAGGANIPLENILDHFVFSPKEEGTFGTCRTLSTVCALGKQRECTGRSNNGKVGEYSPEIDFVGYSTNHPSAEDAVRLTVEVRDDKGPLPGNIVRVDIEYTADGGSPNFARMEFREDLTEPGRPLARFSVWDGEIPPLPAGTVVEFKFIVKDNDGTDERVDPAELCPTGVGPCNDLGLPGNDLPGRDCAKDDVDPVRLFEDCSVPYRYRVGHVPQGDLAKLVINEIVPLQDGILDDRSDKRDDGKLDDNEDFIELYNGSDSEIDLGGLWLSDRPFEPLGTPFPDGAKIGPGEYMIVFTDSDGYQCPRPDEYDESDDEEPQECPDPNTDPNNPALGEEYHTNFSLNAGGEQIYLFDRLENGLGLIHGYEFGSIDENKSWALCPNGDPSGTFEIQSATPRVPNKCALPAIVFRRGDSNGDCQVNITDPVFLLQSLFQGGDDPPCLDAADSNDDGTLNISDPVFVLNFLFAAGSEPNAPGPHASGPDPTGDELGCAVSTPCR